MAKKLEIDNDFYNDLGEKWFEGDDHPIALLRQEQTAKNTWVKTKLESFFGEKKLKVLDVACGGGFLAKELYKSGHDVIGIDKSETTIKSARDKWGVKDRLSFKEADAYNLPFESDSFDVVCAMDFLEHVYKPEKVIKEISRVLKPGGQFFFHTFNRNPISNFLAADLIKICFKGKQPQIHIKELFIKPKELETYCESSNLKVESFFGLSPKFLSKYFWYSLFTRRVHPKFEFVLKKSCLISYLGNAKKGPN